MNMLNTNSWRSRGKCRGRSPSQSLTEEAFISACGNTRGELNLAGPLSADVFLGRLSTENRLE